MHPSFISVASVTNQPKLPRLTNQAGYRGVDEETRSALLAERAEHTGTSPVDMPSVRSAINGVLNEIDVAAGDVFKHPSHVEHFALANAQGSLLLAQWGTFVNTHAYSSALYSWFEANQNDKEKLLASLSTHNLEFGRKIGIQPQDWVTVSPADLKERLGAHLVNYRADWLSQAVWLLWIESLPFVGLDMLRTDQTSKTPLKV
jgi:hypothetical protein